MTRHEKELSETTIHELKDLQGKEKDIEMCHAKADRVLMNLLIDLGFTDVVKEYELIEKWYA